MVAAYAGSFFFLSQALKVIPLGVAYAIVISAVAFGIYHWFSFGIIGNATQMVYVFIITGIMGVLLAYAYTKTYSLYIPIAIHFGWNLMHSFIFSSFILMNGVYLKTNFLIDSHIGSSQSSLFQ